MTEEVRLQLESLKSELQQREYELDRFEDELSDCYTSYFDINHLQQLMDFNSRLQQYFKCKKYIKVLKRNIEEIELANRNGLEKIKDRL